MHLVQHKKYKADLVSALIMFHTNDQVRKQLENVGFVEVSVSGTGKTRSAKGKWGKPTQEFQVPAMLKNALTISEL